MAFVPAVNTARVSLQSNVAGETFINTLWFKKRVGAITIPDLTALAEGMNTWYADNIVLYLSNQLQFIGCVAYDYTTEFAPAVSVAVLDSFGGDTGTALPNNVAFCVKFVTSNRGRSSRGRNYVGPLTQNVRSGANQVQTDFANQMVTSYNAILGLAIDADWEWSVASFRTGGAARAAAFVQPILGSGYSDLVLDSARRRLPGRGD